MIIGYTTQTTIIEMEMSKLVSHNDCSQFRQLHLKLMESKSMSPSALPCHGSDWKVNVGSHTFVRYIADVKGPQARV